MEWDGVISFDWFTPDTYGRIYFVRSRVVYFMLCAVPMGRYPFRRYSCTTELVSDGVDHPRRSTLD